MQRLTVELEQVTLYLVEQHLSALYSMGSIGVGVRRLSTCTNLL